MGWKYKKIDIFEAVEIVKASPNEFVTQDVKIRNCVRAEDASEAINQVLRALWLARAERANEKATLIWVRNELWQAFPPKKAMVQFDKWRWAEQKCLEKAKEFE